MRHITFYRTNFSIVRLSSIVEIITIKIKGTRIHFLSDVSIATAVVVS